MLILDFNDSALRLFDDDLLASSPACAVLEGEHFLLGEEALAKSRLNPRATYLHFWEQLDQQPLNRPAGSARSHADIAYYHLRHLLQRANVGQRDALLVVPAHYGSERLALLLGIAQACSLTVSGLVESAVLAAASVNDTGEPLRYLDISQHRVYVTEVERNGQWQTGASRALSTPGLNWCVEQCVRQISEGFLQETRFDPLHEAASEQRLFDQLSGWWQHLQQQSRVTLELPAGMRQHRIEWRREQVELALTSLYQELQQSVREAPGRVLLSHRLAALPGLVNALTPLGTVDVLSERALVDRARQLQPALCADGEAPLWVKQLPLLAAAENGAPKSARVEPKRQATHLLFGHCALPLGDALNWPADKPLLRLQREGEDFRLAALVDGLRVNGEPVSSEGLLALGDCIETPLGEVQMIRVESGD